jgi:hypothetical protein
MILKQKEITLLLGTFYFKEKECILRNN